MNRVISIRYATGVSTMFEYDGGPSGPATAIGHLSKLSDESGQTTFDYDAFGRTTGKTQLVGVNPGVSYGVRYAYGSSGTATGKLVSFTYPSGNRIDYVYDTNGMLSGLALTPAGGNGTAGNSPVTILDNIQYQPFGPPKSWNWGNHSDAQPNLYSRTFDLDGRVTSYPLGNPAAGGLVRTVNYDAASRIIGMVQVGPGNAAVFDQSFGYDNLDRLTSATVGGKSLAYAYDLNGNRTQAQIGAATYANTISATSNRLNATAGPYPAKTNQFDAAGNLTSDGTVTYTYSDRGRLSQVSNAGVTVNYLYNGLGQRVAKQGTTVPSGATHFVYDEQGQLIGEYDATGAVIEETVYLGNSPVAVLTPPQAGDAVVRVSYIYADHLDTPRVITRSSDNVIVWRWDQSDPFGVGQPDENPSAVGLFSFNGRFPGQVFDRESNNHHNYYRDYDPQTGRYVQSDPIGLGGGLNTYAYVSGNPMSSVDPMGLWSVTYGAYAGAGGQVTFGRDNGNGFLTVRVGLGAGGGFSYNPAGKLPGEAPADRAEGGVAIACTAKASANAGPLQASLEGGVARNYNNGNSTIIGPASPSASGRFSNGWLGGGSIFNLNANANIGAQITFYSGK